MGFGLGALAGAALSIGSSLLSHRNSTAQQQRNISWEKEQLQNRHQWEVEDLKAAGLNPILSANSAAGGAASAPSSGSSEADMARSVKEMALLDAQIDNLNANSAHAIEQARLTGEQANNQPFVRQNMQAQTGLYGLQGLSQQALTNLYGTQAASQTINNATAQREFDFFTKNPHLFAGYMGGKTPNTIYGVGSALGKTLSDFMSWRFGGSSAKTVPSFKFSHSSDFGLSYHGY